MFSKTLIIFFFIAISLQANTSKVILNNESYEFDNFQISYLKDSSENLRFEDVIAKPFLETTNNAFSLGYNKGNVWIRFDTLNRSTEENFILTLNEVFYEKATLFYFDETTWRTKKTGLFTLVKDREIKSNKISFRIKLPKGTQQSIYLKLQAKYSFFGEVSLYKESYFQILSIKNMNTLFIFTLGIAFIILLFNIGMLITFKEKIYLYYTGYGLFSLIYLANISGLLVFLDLQKYIYEMQFSAAYFMGFLILFSTELLQTKQYLGKYNKYLLSFSIPYFLLGTIFFFEYQPWNQILNVMVFLSNLILMIISIYIYLKGYKKSIYYTFALFTYLLLGALFVLMVSNVVPYTEITRYGFVIALAFENVIFSLLIISRYNDLKNSIQANLEDEVKKRTKKIQEINHKLDALVKERGLLLKELYHRAKNNFHIIIGMLWLEGNKTNNEKVFEPIINRIESMSMVHEYLYDSNRVDEIEVDVFFKSIISNLCISPERVTVLENYSFKHKIPLQNAISLGMILNELLTNSIKHNSEEKQLNIVISLANKGKRVYFSTKDDGNGFDQNNINEGIGISLIKDFSSKLENSECLFHTDNGTLFELFYDEVSINS